MEGRCCYPCFFFLAAGQLAVFLGQGSDPSHSRDLSRSCGTTRPLTYCAGLGIKPMSQASQGTADPQWELFFFFFWLLLLFTTLTLSPCHCLPQVRCAIEKITLVNIEKLCPGLIQPFFFSSPVDHGHTKIMPIL